MGRDLDIDGRGLSLSLSLADTVMSLWGIFDKLSDVSFSTGTLSMEFSSVSVVCVIQYMVWWDVMSIPTLVSIRTHLCVF